MADYKVLKNVVGTSLLVGNEVYFTESGESVPYILVNKGNSNNFLFMRKYAPSDKIEFFAEAANIGTSSTERIYAGNTLDVFLSNTFLNRFSAEWQKIFVDNSISVTKIVGDSSEGYGIRRKVFAASATELGVPYQTDGTIPNESPFGSYDYFDTNAKNKRMCQVGDGNGDYVEYWTRSKNDHVGVTYNYYAISINKSGGYDTMTWQKNPFYVRPVISINENVTVVKESSGWRVIPNLPPNRPSSPWYHYTSNNGDEVEISWKPSSDDDGPDAPKYRVQRRLDNGEWENFLETNDTTFTRIIGYKEADSQIDYRVCAFDAYNNSSGWTELATITVVNNLPPTPPSFISVNGKYKGEQIVVTWGNSSDDDNNLKGYKLYRSINGSAYGQIATIDSTTIYRDVAGDWETVKYKVVAYDEAGAESAAKESSVSLYARITMGVEIEDSSDFYDGCEFEYDAGIYEAEHILSFAITDTADNDSYVVSVVLDNDVVLKEMSGITKGVYNVTIPKDAWQKILNGEHTINISVYNTANYSVTEVVRFKKNVSGVNLTLKEPVAVDTAEVVSKFLVNVAGSFPEGSSLVVKVTNNANDASPVWQTVSANEMNTNEFVEFTNKAAVNGSAFNIIVEADRGSATEECYISSVNGMFGRNIFEYIFERLDALEAGAANV